MKIIDLTDLSESKYGELLKKIDIGEYRVATGFNDFSEFERWIYKYGLDLDNNYGIITACIFNNYLKIQLSFREDVTNQIIDDLVDLINQAIQVAECDRVDIWCNNFNSNLVSLLSTRYNFEPNIYMSNEFHYDFKHYVYRDIKPLVARNYSEHYLDEVLQLLEKSFLNIAQKGEFLSGRDYYQHKFLDANSASCELFLLDDQLIGMYSQKNGELEYLALSPEHQGQGYGSKILNHALHSMKETVNRQPFLYCVQSNHKALKFYERERWDLTGKAARLQLKF